MPKVNVYLPQELADWARTAHVNVSAITQEALRRERLLREQADLVAEDRAAGRVDEQEVERWRQRLAQSSSIAPS
jgi:post-segregation antitoxin (ccd killing protein)